VISVHMPGCVHPPGQNGGDAHSCPGLVATLGEVPNSGQVRRADGGVWDTDA